MYDKDHLSACTAIKDTSESDPRQLYIYLLMRESARQTHPEPIKKWKTLRSHDSNKHYLYTFKGLAIRQRKYSCESRKLAPVPGQEFLQDPGVLPVLLLHFRLGLLG